MDTHLWIHVDRHLLGKRVDRGFLEDDQETMNMFRWFRIRLRDFYRKYSFIQSRWVDENLVEEEDREVKRRREHGSS